MKETVTITRHEMAETCSDAINIMVTDKSRSISEISKLLIFAGLIISLMFNEDEEKDHD